MAIDVETNDSPGWWLKKCHKKLEDRSKVITPLYQRYEGDAPMPASMASAPDTARRFYRTSRTNFADLLVKAVKYRLKVARLQTSRDDGEIGDVEAWKTWRAAGMLVEGPDIVRNLIVAGDGYAIVADDNGKPAATSEDPRQVVTIHDPVRQSRIRAGAKFFHDDDLDMDYAYLYRPGRVWVATNPRKARSAVRFGPTWNWSEDHGGAEGQPLPEGFESDVTIVRYRNDEGVGDFARHLDILDRVDHLILQGMVVVTLQAFKQRAIQVAPKDMPDTDPETGETINYDEVLAADPGALWKLPETAKMWESGAVDVTPITTMISKEVERISAVTFTPLSMFTPEGANQSATGASLVREGMTFKIEDKQERIGEAHARTASLIFRMAGGELGSIADPESIRVGWAPAERWTLGERGDAAVKAKASDVPWRTRMLEIWQFSPEQVARMETERTNDLLLLPEQVQQTRSADQSTGTDGA